MFSGSQVLVVGQIDAEPRELVSQSGSRSYRLNLKVSFGWGRGWYEVYAFVPKGYEGDIPQNGDWVLCWSFALTRRKFIPQDENAKDYYKTVLNGNINNVLNMTSLVHQGADYISKIDPGRKDGQQNSDSGSIDEIISDIERSLV